tara:strand:+ start:1681 stop:3678 length:1998 start_codon:yes stop_codon:yes gene_type:complete
MSYYLSVIDETGTSPFIPEVDESLNINDDTVISFSTDLSVKSTFGSNQWDFSSISGGVKYFTFETDLFAEKIIREMKLIQYARLYWSPTCRMISTLRLGTLNKLAGWAEQNSVSIEQMLNDERLRFRILVSIEQLEQREATEIGVLIHELASIRIAHPSFTLAPPNYDLSDEIKEIAQSLPKKRTEQTPVIPHRIYANMITEFEVFLRDFNEHYERIKPFIQLIDDGLGVRLGEGYPITRKGFEKWYRNPKNFDNLMKRYELKEFCEKYDLKVKKDWNGYMTDIAEAARYWVHLFTGMRRNEVSFLDRECLSSLTLKGSKAKIIKGYTSKTIGSGYSKTYWVTADIIDIGIHAAQNIGEMIAYKYDLMLDPEQYPLFVAHQKNACEGTMFHENAAFATGQTGKRLWEMVSRFPSLIVNDSDFTELKHYDGFRDWSKTVTVGEPWPLSTHQCRRSLAVYLARSRLLPLGALQAQFKHLMSAMTAYYRRNSTFAINFILNDEEDEQHQSQIQLMEEIQTEQRLSEYENFEEQVLDKADQLTGPYGMRTKKQLERSTPTVIASDKARVQADFLEGSRNFKPNAVGGCSKVGGPATCDGFTFTTEGEFCFGCAYQSGNDPEFKSAQKVLEKMYKRRDRYSPTSLLFIQEQSAIDEFEKKLKRQKELVDV